MDDAFPGVRACPSTPATGRITAIGLLSAGTGRPSGVPVTDLGSTV